MTDNYEAAKIHADHVAQLANTREPNVAEQLQTAQVRATLAVADELRELTKLLGPVIGYAGAMGASRAFIRVFDEAPH